ncbi:transketolase, pyrimidine binding domain protein, partial [Vibrio parahaemolyticus EKP-021]
APLNPK